VPDHAIRDQCGDQLKVARIRADIGDHLAILEPQLVRVDAGKPMLAQGRERALRRHVARGDRTDQCKQLLAQLLGANQRTTSGTGLAMHLLGQRTQISFRQQPHERGPFEQTRIAVEPVARRLVAAGDGVDEVQGGVAADEVPRGKIVRFDGVRH
jgi:hypothetical protein